MNICPWGDVCHRPEGRAPPPGGGAGFMTVYDGNFSSRGQGETIRRPLWGALLNGGQNDLRLAFPEGVLAIIHQKAATFFSEAVILAPVCCSGALPVPGNGHIWQRYTGLGFLKWAGGRWREKRGILAMSDFTIRENLAGKDLKDL